jgi:hypothetical protein
MLSCFQSIPVGEEAVFAFGGNQPATFTRFGIVIVNASGA